MFSVGYTHKNSLPKRSVRSRTISDYTPFGVLLPERAVNTGDFRYGFQGQEHDDEVKREGNSVNFKYRMHDPRLGRFFAVDPLAAKYPYNGSYNFSENRVIDSGELEGLETYYAADGTKLGQIGTNTDVRVVKANEVENTILSIAYANYNLEKAQTIYKNLENHWHSKACISFAKAKASNYWKIYEKNKALADDVSKKETSLGTYKMTFTGELVESNVMTGKNLNSKTNAAFGILGEARIVEEFTGGFELPVLSSPFTSGPYGNGPTPNHNYTAQEIYETTESGMQNNNKADGWKVTMEDFNGRSGLRIHPDCNSIGTAGCIGLRTTNANLRAFEAMFQRQLEGNGTMKIEFNIPNNPNYGNDGNANPNIGQ
jgi:RHS repeat-associated protein